VATWRWSLVTNLVTFRRLAFGGTAQLFSSNGDVPDAWTVLYNINTSKGSRDAEDYTSGTSFINITSSSGILKILRT
jgi:hypothetical protein